MLGLGDIVSVILFQFLSVLLMYSIYAIPCTYIRIVSAQMKLCEFHIVHLTGSSRAAPMFCDEV